MRSGYEGLFGAVWRNGNPHLSHRDKMIGRGTLGDSPSSQSADIILTRENPQDIASVKTKPGRDFFTLHGLQEIATYLKKCITRQSIVSLSAPAAGR
jgi:hypothetical protein